MDMIGCELDVQKRKTKERKNHCDTHISSLKEPQEVNKHVFGN